MRKVIKCAAVVVMLALFGCGTTCDDTLCQVPDCIGKDHDDAHAAVDVNFEPKCRPGCGLNEDWHVYYQRPSAGSMYTCEQVVELYYK